MAKYTEDEKRRALKEFGALIQQEGWSRSAAAQEVGVMPHTLDAWAKKAMKAKQAKEVSKRRMNQILSAREESDLFQDYARLRAVGLSSKQAARKVGLPVAVFQEWEEEQRAKNRKNTEHAEEAYSHKDRAAALWGWRRLQKAHGASKEHAASFVGVPLVLLEQWMREWETGEGKESKVAVAAEQDAPTETKTYVWEGTITPGEETKGLLAELAEDEENTGPCLVLPNGMRVYGPLDELLFVTEAL